MNRTKWLFAGGLISIILGFCLLQDGGTPRFWASYLCSFLFWIQFPLGCLGFFMIHNLTGGAWGKNLRPAFRAAARTLRFVPLLYVPLFFGMKKLYPWVWLPEITHSDRHLYLNLFFFSFRSIFYLLLWALLGWLIESSSGRVVEVKDLSPGAQYISSWGLVAYVFSMSFASFDWMMSLEPLWHSTIYGMFVIIGQGVAALAFLILYHLRTRGNKNDLQDIANLSLTFVMTWAYLSFMQFLIIWSGNLPVEDQWYLNRIHGGWKFFPQLLTGIGFFLPFFILLSRTAKRQSKIMIGLAILLLLGRALDISWLVLPAIAPEGTSLHFFDLFFCLGIGGLWLAAFEFERTRLV